MNKMFRIILTITFTISILISCKNNQSDSKNDLGEQDIEIAPVQIPDNLEMMFNVPGLPIDPNEINWNGLPLFESEHSLVYRGVENETAFNHHPKIVYWDGRFFAKWNDGYVGEDEPGQRVRYAVSSDGLEWSNPIDLSGRHDERRYTASGFWIRNGEMYALAGLRDSNAEEAIETGEEPLQLAYKWDSDTESFGEPIVMMIDYFAQNKPKQGPDGDWIILGKGGGGEGPFSWGPMKVAKGGVTAIDDWKIIDLAGEGQLEEAEWYTLLNDHLVAHFRTRGERPFFLARHYSTDGGETWTDEPIITNFPEAGARHHGLKLSNGMYALLVNPNPNIRIPFSIALSKDGLVCDRIGNVRSEETSRRWAGRAKGPGYHYMRGFEHEGKLYTIYTVNKEDVEVSIIPISEFEAMYN